GAPPSGPWLDPEQATAPNDPISAAAMNPRKVPSIVRRLPRKRRTAATAAQESGWRATRGPPAPSGLVVDEAALHARPEDERHDGLGVRVGLVGVQRRARFELRVERDVAGVVGPAEIDPALDLQQPGDSPAQRFQLLLDGTRVPRRRPAVGL